MSKKGEYNMKKFLVSSLIATTLLSVTAPNMSVFAEETGKYTPNSENITNSNTTDIKVESSQEEIEHEYEYDGLIISSNVELKEEDFLRIKQEVKETSKKPEITPFGPVSDGTYTGSIIYGPVNRINTNKSVQFVADVFFAWVGTKIPTKYTDSTFKNYIVSSLLGWNAKPTYTSEWISRATYTYNTSYWQYFTTIVRHTSSSFNNPTHVTYYATHIQKK